MASEGVLATLRQGWRALDRVDAPRAVIGGLALTAWKHARYTRDADVLVAVDQQRVGDVVRALAAAGFRPRHDPPLRVIDGQGIVQFTFQRETIARAVPWPLPGGGDDVRVVRPDDLLVIKLLSGRIIDRADAAMVLRENQPDIDFQRLHRAISDHGLAGTYREIWAEAFPDEPPPEIDSRPPSGAGR
jgi:hypothetical protein